MKKVYRLIKKSKIKLKKAYNSQIIFVYKKTREIKMGCQCLKKPENDNMQLVSHIYPMQNKLYGYSELQTSSKIYQTEVSSSITNDFACKNNIYHDLKQNSTETTSKLLPSQVSESNNDKKNPVNKILCQNQPIKTTQLIKRKVIINNKRTSHYLIKKYAQPKKPNQPKNIDDFINGNMDLRQTFIPNSKQYSTKQRQGLYSKISEVSEQSSIRGSKNKQMQELSSPMSRQQSQPNVKWSYTSRLA